MALLKLFFRTFSLGWTWHLTGRHYTCKPKGKQVNFDSREYRTQQVLGGHLIACSGGWCNCFDTSVFIPEQVTASIHWLQNCPGLLSHWHLVVMLGKDEAQLDTILLSIWWMAWVIYQFRLRCWEIYTVITAWNFKLVEQDVSLSWKVKHGPCSPHGVVDELCFAVGFNLKGFSNAVSSPY
jgi:hypothetical protein